MMSNNMFTKTVETKILDLSVENLKVDYEAQQFQRESWPVRREGFKKNRTGEIAANEMSAENWDNTVSFNGNFDKPLIVLIDGTFAHSAAVHFAKKYIDYRKFQASLSDKADTIYYFSASQDSDRIARFLHYIQNIEGCKVVVKSVPKISDTKGSGIPTYKSVAVDMSIVALREAYDNANISHALILSRDPEIIPLIKELKDLDISVALAYSNDIATSRYLKQEANVIVDIYNLFEYLDCYSDTEIKSKDEN